MQVEVVVQPEVDEAEHGGVKLHKDGHELEVDALGRVVGELRSVSLFTRTVTKSNNNNKLIRDHNKCNFYSCQKGLIALSTQARTEWAIFFPGAAPPT